MENGNYSSSFMAKKFLGSGLSAGFISTLGGLRTFGRVVTQWIMNNPAGDWKL